MVPRGVACLDCTIDCERRHSKEGGFLPIVDRFFKIMFGKDRSKFLNLPPESAKIVKHLTNQETQIEDSSGQRWSVTLSLVNRSLAFEKGWQKFYLDHGLKEGELLVFEYTGGSHFTVQIYATSARERTNFNNEMHRRRKKRRRCQGTASEDDVNSRDISISASGDELQNRKTKLAVENAGFEVSELLPIPLDIEDPICMIINNSVAYHDEHRSLYDLSFEMENRTSDANKCEEVAITMSDPHTETEHFDVSVGNASDTKISLSCNRVLEQTNPVGSLHMSIDNFETALDTNTTPSDAEIADEEAMLDSASGCIFQDGSSKIAEREHSVKSKFGEFSISSSTVKNPLGKEPSVMCNHPQMNSPLVEKFSLSCNQVIDTEITDQIRKKVDDTQMAPHSRQAGCHSGDGFMNMFYEKPSYDSKMVMLDNVCNLQDGKPEPFSLSPSIGSSKIAEREHAAKCKFGEFSVSSSTVKNPLGLHAFKKEVKMEDTANVFHQISSGGKEPSLVRNQSQMVSPLVVKVEHDLLYETGQLDTINPLSISPFSAEVKSKLYLEVPLQIMSGRAQRLRAQTIRAHTMRAQMIVYLRDSAQRLWPVVYREYSGGKAFIGNWSRFCEQNNIKPGDNCRFEAEEHAASFVFRVDVARGSR